MHSEGALQSEGPEFSSHHIEPIINFITERPGTRHQCVNSPVLFLVASKCCRAVETAERGTGSTGDDVNREPWLNAVLGRIKILLDPTSQASTTYAAETAKKRPPPAKTLGISLPVRQGCISLSVSPND